MPSQSIRVVARFSVKPDKIDEFVRDVSAKLVEPSRKEPGCRQYDLCHDIDDPTRFVMIEEWQSEEALATHLAQENLQTIVETLRPMAAGPIEVQRVRKVGD